jgi:hypothetical protein
MIEVLKYFKMYSFSFVWVNLKESICTFMYKLCLCKGMFMHRYVHAQVWSCTGTFMYRYVCSCKGMYVHAQVCTCMHRYVHAQLRGMFMHMYVHAYCRYVNAQVCSYRGTFMHRYAHAQWACQFMHMYVHAR